MEDIIKVTNLTKYYNESNVLNKIDLTIKAGEVYGLIGANGAGKSTMIECMLGTKKGESGDISILGCHPFKNRKNLFQQIGVQFQEAHYQDKIRVKELCLETSCLYNNPLDYEQLLHDFNLSEKKNMYIHELSGGQKQKLFIILALIPNPKIIFLDELTTGLDTIARRLVWKSILTLKNQGLTIFLTSHFMDEIEFLCDRIDFLKAGKITFEGTVNEFLIMSPYSSLEEAYLWFVGEGEIGDE